MHLLHLFLNNPNHAGISYSTAKREIAVACYHQMQKQWSAHTTTLRAYKETLGNTPYTTVGTPDQIRFRTEMRIGNPPLNAYQQRFGIASTDKCPYCPTTKETTQHFLCECPAYHEARQELQQTFYEVYHPRERKFDHIGLLQEPRSKAAVERHLPVIKALNQYITSATRTRSMPWA